MENILVTFLIFILVCCSPNHSCCFPHGVLYLEVKRSSKKAMFLNLVYLVINSCLFLAALLRVLDSARCLYINLE